MSVAKRTWTGRDGETRTAWVVRYYDQYRRFRTKTFKTFREAKEWEAQTKVNVKKGIHRADSVSPTLREPTELWLKAMEGEDLERATLDYFERHWRLHIEPATVPQGTRNGWVGNLGDIKVSKITAPICLVFLRHLQSTQHSREMVRKVFGSFRAILREAVGQGMIAVNPASDITVSRKDRDRLPLRIGEQIPSKQDFRLILAALNRRWRPYIFTAGFTGMRASELRGLPWSNVDLDQRKIYVRQRADFAGAIGLCKTPSSNREIPITDALLKVLLEWKERCPPSLFDLVFPAPCGNVEWHANVVHNAWWPVQKRVGLVLPNGRLKYRFHSLRHFFASIMIDQQVQPKRLQEMMGHASIKMTMDVYGHLFPAGEEDLARANRAVDSVLEAANDNSDKNDDTG